MAHIHLAEEGTVRGREDCALREAQAVVVVRKQFRSVGGAEGGQARGGHRYAMLATEAVGLVDRWAVPMGQPMQAEAGHTAGSVLPAEGTAVAVP